MHICVHIFVLVKLSISSYRLQIVIELMYMWTELQLVLFENYCNRTFKMLLKENSYFFACG